eukprot:5795576-Ditylum_brightwellii.AAC.1
MKHCWRTVKAFKTSPQSRSIITPTSLLAGSRMETEQICAGSCAGCLPEMHNARCSRKRSRRKHSGIRSSAQLVVG